MLTIREYKKAESLEEAYTLNQKKSNRVIGGMIWLKMETLNVGTAIDLSGLGLDTIEETETEFRIGAMASLRALELHEGLAAYTNGAMRESVRHIVGVQLRNLATVGGSLYSRFGFSDVLTMFLVLDAQVELYKGGIVPLSEYAERPKDRDILVRIIVPKKNAKFNYQSVRISQTDIPVRLLRMRTAIGSPSVLVRRAHRFMHSLWIKRRSRWQKSFGRKLRPAAVCAAVRSTADTSRVCWCAVRHRRSMQSKGERIC